MDEIEEDIQKARNQYNSYANRFNTLVESFPATFIARKFGFEKQNYFALDLATQRELPEVEFSSFRDSMKYIPNEGDISDVLEKWSKKQ